MQDFFHQQYGWFSSVRLKSNKFRLGHVLSHVKNCWPSVTPSPNWIFLGPEVQFFRIFREKTTTQKKGVLYHWIGRISLRFIPISLPFSMIAMKPAAWRSLTKNFWTKPLQIGVDKKKLLLVTKIQRHYSFWDSSRFITWWRIPSSNPRDTCKHNNLSVLFLMFIQDILHLISCIMEFLSYAYRKKTYKKP